jgi:hypothetical protein
MTKSTLTFHAEDIATALIAVDYFHHPPKAPELAIWSKKCWYADSSIDLKKPGDEDFVDSTSYSARKKNIIPRILSGDLVVFSAHRSRLQSDFTGTAVIELTTIFGGTKLIIPSNWSIKSDAVIIFGGIEEKRKMPAVTENPDKILVLKGTVIFGGIDIKSY